jgi:hypothetical protein
MHLLCLCCPVFRQRPCDEPITRSIVLLSANDHETEKSALCSKVGAREEKKLNSRDLNNFFI